MGHSYQTQQEDILENVNIAKRTLEQRRDTERSVINVQQKIERGLMENGPRQSNQILNEK